MNNNKCQKSFFSRIDDVLSCLIIGKKVTIIAFPKKSNLTSKRIKGLILNESKYTITLQSNNGSIRTYPKDIITFEMDYLDTNIIFSGSLLKGRPEERLKLKLRKKW